MNNNRKNNDEVCALTKSLKAAYKKITELRAENEELRKENAQNAIYRDENTKTFIQMSKEYKIVCSQLEEIKKENHELKKLLAKSIEKEQLKTKEIFGRSSEKIDEILNASVEEIIDEAVEETAVLNHMERRIKHITNNQSTNKGKKKDTKIINKKEVSIYSKLLFGSTICCSIR